MFILAAFVLSSTTFAPGASMPLSAAYTGCGGQNRSPELHWTGAPSATKSFALIVHDPDAPHAGGWYHWVMYDIPAATRTIDASRLSPRPRVGGREGKFLPQKSGLGLNDFKQLIYDGPCPPPGKPHHYNFTLYALDIARIGGDQLTGPQLLDAMHGHILARTTLTGLFGR